MKGQYWFLEVSFDRIPFLRISKEILHCTVQRLDVFGEGWRVGGRGGG